MSYEREMTLRLPPEDLLSAIWHSDGSGRPEGIASTTNPGEWEIVSVWLNKDDGQVEIKLKRVSP